MFQEYRRATADDLSSIADKQADWPGLAFSMNRPRAAAERDGCSILESAKRLGLEPFSVHGLIQRRKVRADLAPSGELVIPETEIERLLSGQTLPLSEAHEK